MRKDREGVLGISTPIYGSQGDRGRGKGGTSKGDLERKYQKGRREVRETDVPAIKRSWEYKERYVLKLDCGVERKLLAGIMWSKSLIRVPER